MIIKSFENYDIDYKINPCFKDIGLSPIVEISERAKTLAKPYQDKTGNPFIYFQRGEVDFLPPDTIRRAISTSILDDNICQWTSCYPKSGGEIRSKGALISHYQRGGITGLEPRNIAITHGGQEGLELVLNMFNGSRVAAFAPIWSCILENIAPYTNSKIAPVPLVEEEGFLKIDFAMLDHILSCGTSILYLNNPHNPTGKVFSRNELLIINTLCINHKVLILSDEAYKDIVFDGKEHISMLEFEGDHIIVSGTASKTYAATGYRFGWLISRNEELISRFITRGNYTQTAGVNTFIQRAFSTILNESSTWRWVACNLAIYQKRRDIIFNELKDLFQGDFYKPEGAFYFFLNLNKFIPKGTKKKDQFVLDTFLENGIAIVPGSAFGTCGTYQGYVRLSYSTVKEEDLIPGIKRFVEVLNKMKDS
jgi:aspartate aminotransferase